MIQQLLDKNHIFCSCELKIFAIKSITEVAIYNNDVYFFVNLFYSMLYYPKQKHKYMSKSQSTRRNIKTLKMANLVTGKHKGNQAGRFRKDKSLLSSSLNPPRVKIYELSRNFITYGNFMWKKYLVIVYDQHIQHSE